MIERDKYHQISTEWHRFFAILPVPINASGDVAVLQWVERRRPLGAAQVTRRLEYRIPGAQMWGVTRPDVSHL